MAQRSAARMKPGRIGRGLRKGTSANAGEARSAGFARHCQAFFNGSLSTMSCRMKPNMKSVFVTR